MADQGVPVLGYQCDTFPAFYSAKSHFPCPGRVDSTMEAARAYFAMERVRPLWFAVLVRPLSSLLSSSRLSGLLVYCFQPS